MQVLLLARGLGFGHAKRDLAVAHILRRHGVRVAIASYASGFIYLRAVGEGAIDLGLPPIGDEAQHIAAVTRCILEQKPEIIVADEELSVLALSRAFGIPSVLITNWMSEDNEILSYLSMARNIFVLDMKDEWMFPVPEVLRDRMLFVGPVINCFSPPLASERSVVITAGGAPSIVDLGFYTVAIAVTRGYPEYRKLVSCGPLLSSLQSLGDSTFEFVDFLPDLANEMAKASLVISRGGHTTLWELAAAGTPSIAVPCPTVPYSISSVNPCNVIYALQMQARGLTEVVIERELSQDTLSAAVDRALDRGRRVWPAPQPSAAEVIVSHLFPVVSYLGHLDCRAKEVGYEASVIATGDFR